MTNSFFLFVFLIIFCSCNSNIKNSAEHYSKAKEYFYSKDYSNSLKEADISIQSDSLNFKSFYLKAKIKERTNLREEAIEIYKKLLERDFELDSTNMEIGENYFDLANNSSRIKADTLKELKFYKQAIFYFNETIKINPHYYEAYISKYKTLHNNSNNEEALDVINKAIKIFPDSISLILYRGVEKFSLGDYKSSLKDLDSSININTYSYYERSETYRFRDLYMKNWIA